MPWHPQFWYTQLGRFLRSHWWHLLLAVPMAVVVTAVHELAHAAAAKAFGAEIGHIWVLPGHGTWGHMSYTLADPNPSAHFWVSLAPGLLGLMVGLIGLVLSLRSWRPWAGSLLFVWGIVVPLLEPMYALVHWLMGAENDGFGAFGTPSWIGAACTLAYGGIVVFLGWEAHGSLYGERALTPVPFGILVLCVAGVMCLV
ncbi:MAG: hypothetical protein ACI9VR_000604 [Cognaticolwellia sp.]|jgi:hypothetical protein